MSARAPRSLGSRYALLEPIGSGGMGEVWRALDKETKEQVAAKVLHRHLVTNPDLVDRFVRERAVLADLRDDRIVALRGMVVEDETLGLVLDLVDGPSLRELLDERRTLTPLEAARITARVLEALAVAHDKGYLHRDVKPGNVLLDRDWAELGPRAVRLGDFGIAGVVQELTRHTSGRLGTPKYMAPELFDDQPSTPATDVYAAGVMLYELIAGRGPFDGGNDYAIIRRHREDAPEPLPVPSALWEVVRGCLAKDPGSRPSAREAAASLHAAEPDLMGRPAAEPLPPLPPAGWSADRSRPDLPVPGSRDTTGPRAGRADAPGGPDATVPRLRRETAGMAPAPVPAPAPPPPAAPPSGTATGQELRHLPGATLPGPRDVTSYTPRARSSRTAAPVDAPETGRWWRQRYALAALGGVLVLTTAAVVGALWLREPAPTPTPRPGSGALTAEQEDERLPTGLTVAREVSVDAAQGVAEVRLAYKSASAGLSGPFFQLLPPPVEGADCPQPRVTGGGATITPNSSSSNITAPCGFAVTLPKPIEPNQEQTVTLRVPLDWEDAREETVQAWLDRLADGTREALTSRAVSGTAFPVQRLQGLQVRLSPEVARVRSALTVELVPQWPAGDDTGPIFTNRAEGAAPRTEVLRAITGESGLVTLSPSQECSSILVITGTDVSAKALAPSCAVRAQVGYFQELESNDVQITTGGA